MNHPWLVFAAAGLVACMACDEARVSDAAGSVSLSAEAGQRAPDSVDEGGEPAAVSYNLLKQAALADLQPFTGPPSDHFQTIVTGPKEEVTIFDVFDCHEDLASVEISKQSDDTALLEALARRVVTLEGSLDHAGYRREVFAEPLAVYERRMLRLLAGNPDPQPPVPNYYYLPPDGEVDRTSMELAHFALLADANRARLQPQMPSIRVEGGCGAGEGDFRIQPQPADGRVWMITRFGFQLCRVRRIDPWDRERCDRWSEVAADTTAALSGTYMYQARWPDGRAGRGMRTLDGLEAANAAFSGKPPPTVTIRPD